MGIIENMIEKYKSELTEYTRMYNYYIGKHDIEKEYKQLEKRSNLITISNYINKFTEEEVTWALGNPITYTRVSDDTGEGKEAVECINTNLFHWRDNHDQELMRQLEIFGVCYLLWYIDTDPVDGNTRFNEKILNPMNAIVYRDDSGKVQYLIHFYTLPFDDSQYYDVYYPLGTVETYKDGTLTTSRKLIFGDIPAYVCEMDNPYNTIYHKIKYNQDCYNHVLADMTNLVSDYRNGILMAKGRQLNEAEKAEIKQEMRTGSFIAFDGELDISWLTKDINDGFVENNLERHRNMMYELTNHIDSNEQLQSNTSGVALENRLIFLRQRCDSILKCVTDAVYERIHRLFQYIYLISDLKYDWKKIKVNTKLAIPRDITALVQAYSQLGIGRNITRKTVLDKVPELCDDSEAEDRALSEAEEAEKYLDGIGDDE